LCWFTKQQHMIEPPISANKPAIASEILAGFMLQLCEDLLQRFYTKLSASNWKIRKATAVYHCTAYGDSGNGVSIGLCINQLSSCYQQRTRGSWINYYLFKKLKWVRVINQEFFKWFK